MGIFWADTGTIGCKRLKCLAMITFKQPTPSAASRYMYMYIEVGNI